MVDAHVAVLRLRWDLKGCAAIGGVMFPLLAVSNAQQVATWRLRS